MHPVLLILLSSASAERWYYPNESDTQVEMPSGFALSGTLIVGLKTTQDFHTHPEILAWSWLREESGIALVELDSGADELAFSRRLHQQPNV